MKNKKRFFNLLPGSVKTEQPKNVVNDARSEATIYIYDEISWWGINAEWFVAQINSLSAVPVINLRVNCPGGDYFEAMAMQTAMAQHPSQFVAHIDGMAASAASFFIRGANKRIISDGGFLMIHQAIGGMYGNSGDLISRGNALSKIDDNLIEEYIKVTGLEESQVRAWVEAETWFSAKEALEHGFVDEIVEAAPTENIFDLSGYKNVPQNLIKDLGNKMKIPGEPKTEPKPKYDMDAIAREIDLAEACI